MRFQVSCFGVLGFRVKGLGILEASTTLLAAAGQAAHAQALEDLGHVTESVLVGAVGDDLGQEKVFQGLGFGVWGLGFRGV